MHCRSWVVLLKNEIGKAKTELEKEFIKSLEVLYGEGAKADRDQAYAQFMGKLYKRYPDNHEVASFYALSHCWVR
jgi:hypothetical protein